MYTGDRNGDGISGKESYKIMDNIRRIMGKN